MVPQGATNAARLVAIVEDRDSGLPPDAGATLKSLVAALTRLETEIGGLDAAIAHRARENELARRLMTVPGIGPLIATAIAVLAPPQTLRARGFDLDPAFEHHTGPRRVDGRIRGRTHVSTR